MRRSAGSLLALLVAAALPVAGCTGRYHEPRVSGEVSVEGEHTRVEVAFGDRERRVIRGYYEDRGEGRGPPGGLPPGLAKQGKVPPGHARPGHRLPPEAEAERLPDDLEERLGEPPEGYIRVRVGTDILLVEAETRTVADAVEITVEQ